jgi:hypothetical protein
MVRKFLLYFEIALLGLLQVIGLTSAIVGFFPALAQGTPPNETAHRSEAARIDPTIVQDFMATLPASDAIKSRYKDAPPPNDQRLYSAQAGAVADHRFFTARKRGGKEMTKLIGAAEAAFTQRCSAQGGKLLEKNSELYIGNETRFQRTVNARYSTVNGGYRSYADKPDVEFNLYICMRGPQALGLMAMAGTRGDNSRDVGGLGPLSLALAKDTSTFTLISLRPENIYAQADLDKEIAAQKASEARQASIDAQKQAELEQWRQGIRVGTETSCGPVLSVKGDMVELVHYQTRDPRWYRRNELWPHLSMRGC